MKLSSDDVDYYLSLALQSVLQYHDIKVKKDSRLGLTNALGESLLGVIINDFKVQTIANEASIVVNFYGPVSNIFKTFKRYSLSQIIDTHNYTLSGYEDDKAERIFNQGLDNVFIQYYSNIL